MRTFVTLNLNAAGIELKKLSIEKVPSIEKLMRFPVKFKHLRIYGGKGTPIALNCTQTSEMLGAKSRKVLHSQKIRELECVPLKSQNSAAANSQSI
jgi:hypothetical protein